MLLDGPHWLARQGMPALAQPRMSTESYYLIDSLEQPQFLERTSTAVEEQTQ
jgi:hypothetical protein